MSPKRTIHKSFAIFVFTVVLFALMASPVASTLQKFVDAQNKVVWIDSETGVVVSPTGNYLGKASFTSYEENKPVYKGDKTSYKLAPDAADAKPPAEVQNTADLQSAMSKSLADTAAPDEEIPPVAATGTAPGASAKGAPATPEKPVEPKKTHNDQTGSDIYETDGVNYEVASDGTVWELYPSGTRKTISPVTKAQVEEASRNLAKSEKAKEEAKKKAGDAKDNKAAAVTGGDDEKDSPSRPAFGKVTTEGFIKRVQASGGWASAFFKPGSNQQFWISIGRWYGVQEPAWPGFVDFMQSWSPTNLANSIFCENRLGDDTGQRIGMSNSGRSWISAEGVKIRVNPCPTGLAGKTPSSNISCKPYWLYRISGEAMPSEVRLYFNVKLQPGNIDMYDGFTIKAEKGSTKWSLSGTNMFVFNSTKEYTQVCIDFDDGTFTEVQTVFLALDNDDDPLCNDIVTTPQNPEQVFTTGPGGVIVPPSSKGGGGAGGQSQIPPSPSKNL
ncbi:hypothetical protein HY772_05785 [Candidatus Woesearchaeota archaeon]|nr:hypothetical protein [Candidatus Woesearchaeota archaeon]